MLSSNGVTSEQLRSDVEARVERGPSSAEATFELPYTGRAKAALDCMIDEAARLRATKADPEHLLFGLAAEGQGIASTVLSAHGFGIDRLRSLAGPPKPTAFDRLSRWFRRA